MTSGIGASVTAARHAASALAGIALARKIAGRVWHANRTCPGVYRIRLTGPLELRQQLAVIKAVALKRASTRSVRPSAFHRGKMEALLETVGCHTDPAAILRSIAVPGFTLRVQAATSHGLRVVAWPASPPSPEKP